jgi:hypothetical protein
MWSSTIYVACFFSGCVFVFRVLPSLSHYHRHIVLYSPPLPPPRPSRRKWHWQWKMDLAARIEKRRHTRRQPRATWQRFSGWREKSLLGQSLIPRSWCVQQNSCLTVSPKQLQLVFNLTSATQWTEEYNGFNFAAFYNFIIDFFEEASGTQAKRRAEKLLAWWTKYDMHLIFYGPDYYGSADKWLQASLPPSCCHNIQLPQIS